jgi:hypothetical protein
VTKPQNYVGINIGRVWEHFGRFFETSLATHFNIGRVLEHFGRFFVSSLATLFCVAGDENSARPSAVD